MNRFSILILFFFFVQCLLLFLDRLGIKSKRHTAVGKNTISFYTTCSKTNNSNNFLVFKFLLKNSNSESFIRFVKIIFSSSVKRPSFFELKFEFAAVAQRDQKFNAEH